MSAMGDYDLYLQETGRTDSPESQEAYMVALRTTPWTAERASEPHICGSTVNMTDTPCPRCGAIGAL